MPMPCGAHGTAPRSREVLQSSELETDWSFRQGKTALHLAAEKGKTAAVEVLIAAGGDIATRGENVSGEERVRGLGLEGLGLHAYLATYIYIKIVKADIFFCSPQ
jgi:hypothetical protein